jgi:uncharacterized membrane protein
MLQAIGSKALTGILVLVPVAIVGLVLVEIHDLLAAVIDPLTARLPVQVVMGTDITWLVTIGVLVGLFITVGWLLETGIGERANRWLEETILNHIPGYSLARSLTQGVAGRHAEESFSVALVSLYEGGPATLALVVERGEDSCTIFVPQAPTPTLGFVYVVPHERVQPVDLPATSVINGIMQWGIGTQELLARAKAQSSHG